MLLRHPKTVSCQDTREAVDVAHSKLRSEMAPLMALDADMGLDVLWKIFGDVGGDSLKNWGSWVVGNDNLRSDQQGT
jgi:hypothetical protein